MYAATVLLPLVLSVFRRAREDTVLPLLLYPGLVPAASSLPFPVSHVNP